MPNIAPINLSEPGAAEDIVRAVKAKMGTVPNIFATMAQSPSVLDGYLAFNGALASGALDAGIREQIALAVAGENDCNYCSSAHTLLAKHAGIDKAEAALNLTGKATDPDVAVMIDFAREVVRSRGHVRETALSELRAVGITDAEIVEILAHVGLNLFTNYFNHVADIEIDFPFVPATTKAGAA